MIGLRRFNELGLERFRDYLIEANGGGTVEPPPRLLASDEMTEVVDARPLPDGEFASRLEMAAAAHDSFGGLLGSGLDRDSRFWAWVALAWIDVLLPKEKGKRGRPLSIYRWIPDVNNPRTFHRHLVAGPVLIYGDHRDNPDRALAVLCGRPSRPGEVSEQLLSNRTLCSSPGIMEVASRLYVNPETRVLKRGASGKSSGSARRLIDVLAQLERTWDVQSLSADQILDLLPDEFGRFHER